LARRFNTHKDEGGEPAEITDLPLSTESQVDVGSSTITKGESA
jgi:hypothetical protein